MFTCIHFTICIIVAPAILRMLQHVVTEKVFWKGIEIFFDNVKEK